MLASSALFALNFHVSLKAEPLFKFGPLTITNSMLYGVIVSTVLACLMVAVASKSTIKPRKGIANLIEVTTEFILGVLEGSLGSREAAIKYTPYFGVYFFFILFTNLTALVPIVGPALTHMVHGEKIPLLRPYTADLNATIALAVIGVVMVLYFSIREQGLKAHLSHYFFNQPKNPVYFSLGLIEIMGEFIRVVTLSLRLFLNTAIGEILIGVFTSIVIGYGRTPIVVLPILMLEIMVGTIQAYVFTVLCATYLGLATEHHREAQRSNADHALQQT